MNITTERIDDFPLLLEVMLRLGLQPFSALPWAFGSPRTNSWVVAAAFPSN